MAPELTAPASRDVRDPWHEPPTALADLSAANRAKLGRISSHRVFAGGEVILREASVTPFLGLIEEGRIGLRLAVPERGDRTVVTLERGELIGWSAVVPPYRATSEAVALEPTRLETYPAAELRELLAADAALASELLPVLLVALSDRLTTSWQQLLDLFASSPVDPW